MSSCKVNAPKDAPRLTPPVLPPKEYKTIIMSVDYPNVFDTDINNAVKDGWKLTERTFIPANDNYKERKLIAFLERYVKE